jgi:hypothetical protein
MGFLFYSYSLEMGHFVFLRFTKLRFSEIIKMPKINLNDNIDNKQEL